MGSRLTPHWLAAPESEHSRRNGSARPSTDQSVRYVGRSGVCAMSRDAPVRSDVTSFRGNLMIKKSSAIAVAAASLLWSAAALADGCHSGPFNGLYIGASVGYAGLDAEQYPRNEPKLSDDDGSAIVGGHVGYNVQCGRVVFGVEGDISYVDLSTNSVQPDLTSYTTTLDAFATLRGRLGVVVHENTLLYATAGVAWADRSHHLDAPGAPGGPFSQHDSDWATGWVVGGGVEFLRHDRWLVRAEVLWAELDDESRTYVVSTCGVLCEAHVRWEETVVTARIGVSLKLGGHEPAAYEPLK